MKDKLNYRYETLEIGDLDIHIRSLRDIQQYQDDDNKALDAGINDTLWSISGVLWPASFVLATIMERRELKQLKILEVGCGLALASIVLKVRGADITATDNNPVVQDFLAENSRINQCSEISFKQADWKDEVATSNERYDLIIGSDILYEREHPHDLCRFINMKAKENCEVIIVDPKRGNKNKFTKIMHENNFIYSQDDEVYLERFHMNFKGTVNYYKRSV